MFEIPCLSRLLSVVKKNGKSARNLVKNDYETISFNFSKIFQANHPHTQHPAPWSPRQRCAPQRRTPATSHRHGTDDSVRTRPHPGRHVAAAARPEPQNTCGQSQTRTPDPAKVGLCRRRHATGRQPAGTAQQRSVTTDNNQRRSVSWISSRRGPNF